MSAPGSDFFLDLWTAGHMGERLAAEELQKKGVDGEQLTVLIRLAAEERPVTQSALAAAIGVPFSTMTHALGRLVERGEAERLPHPDRPSRAARPDHGRRTQIILRGTVLLLEPDEAQSA